MAREIETKKRDFMLNEAFVASWNASVQRASLYSPDASDDAKENLKKVIFQLLKSVVVPSYDRPCPEDEHLKNIELLVAAASMRGGAILLSGGYKYGVAQKLVNLYLKYLWCMGHIKEPPHCPVDRIILAKTELRDKLNWTQIINREQYMSAINALKKVANSHQQSLATWELLNYEP